MLCGSLRVGGCRVPGYSNIVLRPLMFRMRQWEGFMHSRPSGYSRDSSIAVYQFINALLVSFAEIFCVARYISIYVESIGELIVAL